MTNAQRTKNDFATMDRREITDKIIRDNRVKNDQLTIERRDRADKTREDNRLRNDEITNNRRKINDRNPWRTLAISLLVLALLAIGVYYFFF
jgi:hypothetical protein